MEVKNPMMDQLLVNTAAQTGASQSAKAPKDADRPDFDSMVSQRRGTDAKPDAKGTKAAKQPEKAEKAEKPVAADGAQDSTPVTGEQYAITAALMMQAMPDGPRMAQVPSELIAAENTVTVEAVLSDDVQTPAETVETPNVVQEVAVEAEVETAQPTQTQEFAAPVQRAGDADAVRTEAAVETEPHMERTEQKPDEQPQLRPQRAEREDAPRTERAIEAPRFVRNEDGGEETAPDDAVSAQATPLFERVETAPVKVAEAPRPIPLAAENGIEQLGEEIDGVLVNSVDVDRIEVTLTPDNLGKLTVEISRGENGALSIVLHPSTERAASLLERHTGDLQNAMLTSARNSVQVEVRPAEESQQQFLNPDGQNEQQRQQQQQQQRRQENRNAQDFLQQLRLGLVDVEDGEQ